MKRKSLITAFSLPKQLDDNLKSIQAKSGKTRSELLREMIDYYVESTKKTSTSPNPTDSITDSDANKVLKLYYQLLSETRPKPSLVIGVAIVNKKDQVLIGLRRTNDKLVKDLHWTFPSGKMDNLNFDANIIKSAKLETGLIVKPLHLIHARLIPDSLHKSVRIVALYYHCRILSGKQRPSHNFKELKWVPATEVNRHFTTSVSDEIMHFLGEL